MRVRDEADVIEDTVYHTLDQVDEVIVSDNSSTDGTREILEELPVTLLDDPDVAYFQSLKMTALSEIARERGHEWVVPIDADELWHSDFGPIGEVLLNQPNSIQVVEAVLFDHVATAADPVQGRAFEIMGWRRREPAPLPKVAARLLLGLVIEQGNHGAHYPGRVRHQPEAFSIRHFPYRSIAQFERKVRNGAAAYAASDLPESMGQHWRDYGRLLDSGGPEALAEVFRTWFWSAEPSIDETLIYDPAPLRPHDKEMQDEDQGPASDAAAAGRSMGHCWRRPCE